MLNFSFNRWLLLAVGVGVPVAIFFAARSAASWRPQFIGKQAHVLAFQNRGSEFLRLSPDEKWLVSEGDDHDKSFLWDLSGTRPKRVLHGAHAVFSSDSQFIASTSLRSQDIVLDDLASQRWKAHIGGSALDFNLRFVLGNEAVQYQVESFYPPKSAIQLDVKDGRVLGQTKLPPSPWQEDVDYQNAAGDIMRKRISFFPTGSGPRFFFDVRGEADQWEVAPDDLRLWVSDFARSRIDILDAWTGRRVWFYSTTDVDSGVFNCYPSWGNGGKTLATIENDTLVVRDSESGKIVLSHKNNLPAPLKSWAFTKNRDLVYLMDSKGEIFRQQLR